MYLLIISYGSGRNDFDAGSIHYKGHWKGWALKIERDWEGHGSNNYKDTKP
jgi:hypothetical protein